MGNNPKKSLLPYLSDQEHERLSATLSELSRNSMIRFEVMAKRSKGITVEKACVAVAEEMGLSPERIRNIYYER